MTKYFPCFRFLLWFSLVCLLLLMTTQTSPAKEPQWIFNHGSDAQKLIIGQGGHFCELGLLAIYPTGSDLTVQTPFDKEDYFSADQYHWFALRYKMKSNQKIGGLFFTTDTLKTLSDKSFSSFPIVADGQWHNMVIDMTTYRHQNWKGTITQFRLDPTNPSDSNSTISLSRLGFFKSKEEGEKFLNQANDTPDYQQETTLVTPLQHCIILPGTLSDGWQRNDWLLDKDPDQNEIRQKLQSPNTSADQFVLARVKSGTKGNVVEDIVPLAVTNSRGYTSYIINKKGPFRLIFDETSSRLTDLPQGDTARDIRFVVARRLMTEKSPGRFEPKSPFPTEEQESLFARLKNEGILIPADSGKNTTILRTREDAARYVADLIRVQTQMKSESRWPASWFTRDRIRIGAWANFDPNCFDENTIRDYADCGFDWLLAISTTSGTKHRTSLMQWCNKYGIEVIVNDGAYRQPETSMADYFDQPCFSGHYIIDEPGSDSFDKLAKICNKYTEVTGGKTPYVNLLPMYANAAQLKYGAAAAAIEYYDSDPALFKKYCDAFCEKFKTNYICTDIYPLNDIKDKKVTYRDYIESINIIATSAREHNKDFWCFIQVFGWTKGKRTPTEAEFRWQCYSMLSFGCKGILAWEYVGYHPDFPSLLDRKSQKRPSWYDSRNVFHEVRRLSDHFVKYRNLGAFNHQYSDAVPYLRMSHPYTNFKTIKKIDCQDPLLIGCFEEKGNSGPKSTAFTLVNMTEFQEAKGISPRIKIDGQKVIAYYRGIPEVQQPDAEGFHTFHLGSGEGVFITVDEK